MLRGVVLALVLFEGVAWADGPLARARDAIAASEYLAARAALAQVRDDGGCSPAETAELYQLTGIVEAALDNPDAATEAFARLIALSPKVALPAGMSPKITRPFEIAALSFIQDSPLALRIETRGDPPAITAIVVSDPLHMVAKVRVAYTIDGGAEQTRELELAERTDIVLLGGERVAARVAVLDHDGNRLVEYGVAEPIAIVAVAPPVAPLPQVRVHVRPRPIYLRWWPYAAAAVALGGATAYFGWSAHAAATDLQELDSHSIGHSWREADELRDRGRRDTLLTNIGLAATGACAITAGVLFALRTPGAETRVTAAPLPGGGALALQGRF